MFESGAVLCHSEGLGGTSGGHVAEVYRSVRGYSVIQLVASFSALVFGGCRCRG